MARRGRPSNVRPAPFSITPAIVRGVLGLASRPSSAVVNVPIAPFKLVDRPRRSEAPRLARANDDAPTDAARGQHETPIDAPRRAAKIDLNSVPSAMEQLAETWRLPKGGAA